MSMFRSRRVTRCVSALALACGLAPRAVAQTKMEGDSIHASRTLFTWRDGVLAGTFTALTVAMFPLDQQTARELQDSTTQASHFLKNSSRAVQYFADPGSIIIGVGMYGVGRIAGWHTLADL